MSAGARRRREVIVAERLYSIEEAATLWSVSRDTIERLLGRGELRHVSIGGRRRIPASALEEHTNRPAPPPAIVDEEAGS